MTYSIVVSSIGQAPAVNVAVSDPAPDGIAYVSATASDPAVSCTASAAIVTCSRSGALDPGQSFVVTVKATASRVGTLTNTVTVGNDEVETSSTNNQSSARTLVTPPLTPPVKPKPPGKTLICVYLRVSQKTVGVDRNSKLTFVATAAGKAVRGVRVRIKGAGVSRTAVSGKNGKVSLKFTARTPGILTISITGRKGCNTVRVGVVGAFEPPVTG